MKYLLVVLVVLNTSFIELPKRYWICCGSITEENVACWISAYVVEANDYKTAKSIYTEELKSHKFKGKTTIDFFDVKELKKEDILK